MKMSNILKYQDSLAKNMSVPLFGRRWLMDDNDLKQFNISGCWNKKRYFAFTVSAGPGVEPY